MIINDIDTKDISVILQGPIEIPVTKDCIESIRKHLPESEIILSTWKGSYVDELDYDILILNEDPGAKICDSINMVTNNANRQLISTKNGIIKSTKKYIFKVRTDSIILNNNFLNYFNKFNVYNNKYKIVNSRIIVSSIYSKEYSCENLFKVLFHPSDFFMFGYANDIKDYFIDTPIINDIELSNYPLKYPNRIPFKAFFFRYAPEQYFCYSWVKRHFNNIIFDDWSDWHYTNLEQSINILYNNFVFLETEQSGFYNKKHAYYFDNINAMPGLISYNTFQNNYKKLCDPSYIIEINNNNNNNNNNIFAILGNFIFSIASLQNKKIITILGFKITIKKKKNEY